ncbi:MAG: hypothetical protein U0531_18130 [Dehalococcoidia bacterium]
MRRLRLGDSRALLLVLALGALAAVEAMALWTWRPTGGPARTDAALAVAEPLLRDPHPGPATDDALGQALVRLQRADIGLAAAQRHADWLASLLGAAGSLPAGPAAWPRSGR